MGGRNSMKTVIKYFALYESLDLERMKADSEIQKLKEKEESLKTFAQSREIDLETQEAAREKLTQICQKLIYHQRQLQKCNRLLNGNDETVGVVQRLQDEMQKFKNRMKKSRFITITTCTQLKAYAFLRSQVGFSLGWVMGLNTDGGVRALQRLLRVPGRLRHAGGEPYAGDEDSSGPDCGDEGLVPPMELAPDSSDEMPPLEDVPVDVDGDGGAAFHQQGLPVETQEEVAGFHQQELPVETQEETQEEVAGFHQQELPVETQEEVAENEVAGIRVEVAETDDYLDFGGLFNESATGTFKDYATSEEFHRTLLEIFPEQQRSREEQHREEQQHSEQQSREEHREEQQQ